MVRSGANFQVTEIVLAKRQTGEGTVLTPSLAAGSQTDPISRRLLVSGLTDRFFPIRKQSPPEIRAWASRLAAGPLQPVAARKEVARTRACTSTRQEGTGPARRWQPRAGLESERARRPGVERSCFNRGSCALRRVGQRCCCGGAWRAARRRRSGWGRGAALFVQRLLPPLDSGLGDTRLTWGAWGRLSTPAPGPRRGVS